MMTGLGRLVYNYTTSLHLPPHLGQQHLERRWHANAMWLLAEDVTRR